MDDNTQLVQKEEDDQNLLSMMLNRCLSTGSSEGDSQSRETNVDYLSWSNISREASTLEFSRAEDFVLYLTEDCQSGLNLNAAQTENIFSNMNCLIIHRHEGWAAKLGDILRKLLSRSIWNLGQTNALSNWMMTRLVSLILTFPQMASNLSYDVGGVQCSLK